MRHLTAVIEELGEERVGGLKAGFTQCLNLLQETAVFVHATVTPVPRQACFPLETIHLRFVGLMHQPCSGKKTQVAFAFAKKKKNNNKIELVFALVEEDGLHSYSESSCFL